MKTFEQDLQEAVAYHGHLCSGQLTGVRMARLGLKLLGIAEPKSFRDLIVYVECDRCLTDAIGTVTGCKLGKRNKQQCISHYSPMKSNYCGFAAPAAQRRLKSSLTIF